MECINGWFWIEVCVCQDSSDKRILKTAEDWYYNKNFEYPDDNYTDKYPIRTANGMHFNSGDTLLNSSFFFRDDD